MVHRSMRNGSRVADEMYIKRVLLVLEDFLFFSLYSFSCIAKQVTTLKQFRLLSCLDSLETNIEPLVLFWGITLLLPISPTSDSARYTRTSSTTTYLILNVPIPLYRVYILFWTLLCFLLSLPSTEPPFDTRLRQLHWPVAPTYRI